MSAHNKILSVIKQNEWICFKDICDRLNTNTQELYRAWQDLKVSGRLQIGTSGLYRINQ